MPLFWIYVQILLYFWETAFRQVPWAFLKKSLGIHNFISLWPACTCVFVKKDKKAPLLSLGRDFFWQLLSFYPFVCKSHVNVWCRPAATVLFKPNRLSQGKTRLQRESTCLLLCNPGLRVERTAKKGESTSWQTNLSGFSKGGLGFFSFCAS